ncbi:hypothetical protein PVAP13_7KG317746 [Panicum virgatum]|uniref:RBR-type E3 ubiquitin transferase n=1 Tax=Panicum virgatum TaxID=38727 RepID=A0A8T0QPD0_PANVG|nr:hypothetical protein PVAP13_7KG317746 [Panicum virgatum]
MDAPQVSQLCEMLDTIWAELKGQEVMYQWVEWLRDSSRSHLWFDGKITLGTDIVTHHRYNHAISRTNSLESVIPLMMSYSSKKHYQAFLEDLHMCMICLNQSKGSNFVRLSCQHFFCVKCMKTLCRMHVKEGSVFQLLCPDTKCNASIPPYVLKRLLTEEEFERWDRLVLKKALDSMSDVVYCPRCGIGCLEDESNDAECPKCSFIFCSLCKEPCHPAKQCVTPEEKIKHQQASGKMSTRRWHGNCSPSENCSVISNYVQNAECPSSKQKGATRCRAATAVNCSASAVAGPSAAMIISGMNASSLSYVSIAT